MYFDSMLRRILIALWLVPVRLKSIVGRHHGTYHGTCSGMLFAPGADSR